MRSNYARGNLLQASTSYSQTSRDVLIRKTRNIVGESKGWIVAARAEKKPAPIQVAEDEQLFVPSELLFEATLQQCEAPGSALWSLPPTWRIMLLSDGSVTRHLKLLTGQEPSVECFDMRDVHSLPEVVQCGNAAQWEASTSQLPGAAEPAKGLTDGGNFSACITGAILQRQVFIRDARDNRPLVYAASWWNKSEADRYLKDKNKSMWRSLQEGHLELYRDIGRIVRGHSPALEQHFGVEGPLWGRYYTFWSGNKPLTIIYEAFSPSIEKFF